MPIPTPSDPWAWPVTRKALLWLWLPILLITAAHFLTPDTEDWLHDILRRLYYMPIILAAFLFGLLGSLAVALVSSVLYLPHAFMMMDHQGSMLHHDPTGTANKVLEILLYNVVALVTGLLVEREHRARAELEQQMVQMRTIEAQVVRTGRLQALGQLSAGLAHEIRNPLATLKTAAALVGDEIPETSPRRRFVGILQQELERLEGLLERFLAFARPAALLVRQVDVVEVIERATALARPQANLRGILIETSSAASASLSCDPDRLAQVLLNLLLNAVQFSPAQGIIEVAYERRALPQGTFHVIRVRDEGPGVEPAHREQMFDPFFTTRPEGTGLGLSIASRLMDEHGGWIEEENRPEGGAEFRVVLPA
jgi:two-component system sensor histidine kinase HydH